jgi:hypothetical protein
MISFGNCDEWSRLGLAGSQMGLRDCLPLPLPPLVILFGPGAPFEVPAVVDKGPVADSWLIVVSANISELVKRSAWDSRQCSVA